MRYLSVCSGIEAASVAWKHLGWKAVALSEIEKFPCEVLKHHYPDVPNLGDMTLLTKNEYLNGQQIDLLVGGTPCQSFSVAGLRAGLDDERGNLAIEYIRLLEHKRPKWFLWENVPGVLSSNGGADFASILSGWTGRDIASQSFGLSGVIEGEFYSVAWRVLDSRYFGVPQRRRRVFVVGHIGGDWRPSVAVLFERKSLRRDFTPSGGKRKRPPKGTEGSTGVGSINCKPHGISGAMTSKWAKGTGGPAGDEHYNLIVTPSWWDGGQTAHTLTKNSENQRMPDKGNLSAVIVPSAYGIQANIVDRSEKSGANGLGVKEEEAFTLTKGDRQCVMQPANSYNNVIYSDTVGCLQARDYKGVGSQYVDESKLVIAQPIVLDDQDGSVMSVYENGQTGTLRAQTHGHEPIVCYFDDRRQGLEINEEITPTAIKHWGNSPHNIPFVKQDLVCFGFDSLSSNSMKSSNPHSGVHVDDIVKTLDTSVPCPSKNQGGNAILHLNKAMVRRLTPLECCRLQGFPDNFMASVPNATDAKWYAALGNSMTVNVMKWIGERIDKVDKLIRNL